MTRGREDCGSRNEEVSEGVARGSVRGSETLAVAGAEVGVLHGIQFIDRRH